MNSKSSLQNLNEKIIGLCCINTPLVLSISLKCDAVQQPPFSKSEKGIFVSQQNVKHSLH